uniref:EFhand domaincontaining protein C14orf143 homolog putative n=1 Tax=Albugo laibachii Nc14 TaxID=890382 RepID=F0WXT1_9STRA|nr:EFhand domaincontaining protein C14orf143 homolog putative [Albugo laibachii Nc14]|eukprot:CCA26279.1 EFhand domaincontaining protein C14orf143 homolog putative [Albugo laibachii Nc14]
MFYTAEDHLLLLSHCFQHFDANSKGYLDESELKCAVVAALGIQPSRLILSEIFAHQFDSDSIQINRTEFLSTLQDRFSNAKGMEYGRRLFKAMDLRCDGFISRENFISICGRYTPRLALSTVIAAFDEADSDRDQRVTYSDFERIMRIACDLERNEHSQIPNPRSRISTETSVNSGHNAPNRIDHRILSSDEANVRHCSSQLY